MPQSPLTFYRIRPAMIGSARVLALILPSGQIVKVIQASPTSAD